MFEFDLTDREFQIGLLLLIVAIILFPIVLSQHGGQNALQVFSVIVSSLLTLGLVVLYFQQASILDRQTSLMSRDYQSALSIKGTVVADEDEVRVRIRNSGRGKVHRLFLKAEILSETGELEIGHGRVQMKNADSGDLEIPPESVYSDYVGEVNLRVLGHERYDPERHFPFRLISRMVSGRGIETVHLKLSLEVVDEETMGGEFSYTIEIADQELSLKPPEVTEDEPERTIDQSTTVEEGIETEYSSQQDINKIRVEQLAHESDSISVENS